MSLGLYRALTQFGGPAIGLYLRRRLLRGKEDEARFGERLGQPSLPRPQGTLIWCHAASVGEAISILPLVALLHEKHGAAILVTTGTVTSARLMAERLPQGAFHQYVPVDRPIWVRRFLDHWRPDLALWTESEFWPNLVTETAARTIPMVLLNGRISERSFRRWRRLSGLSGQLLGCFSLCLGQTSEDAERLRQLGAKRSLCLGNLKFAVPPLAADAAQLAALRQSVGARPLWLAASTHPQEEALAGRVHLVLSRDFPEILSVIAPRHPERGDSIAAELRAMGLQVAQRSKGETITAQTQIYLADSLGEMGLFFRLAPLVWMGKSLLGQGGQNPLEPARLGASVLFGPHMGNFVDIAGRMQQAGAALEVADEAALAAGLAARIRDRALAAEEGRKAEAFASAEDGVLEAVAGALSEFLPKAAAGGGSGERDAGT